MVPPPGSERRRAQRFTVENVRGVLTFSTEARVVNISLTGLAIETTERLRIGRTYSLGLRFDDAAEVRLSGTAVWCQLRQSRDQATGQSKVLYSAGLTFDGMLSEKAEQLVEFLKLAAVVSVQTRICGRFRAHVAAGVALDTSYEFQVKTLSVMGMAIVTELRAEPDSRFDMELALDDGPLQTRGRVASVSPVKGAKPEKWELGVEFDDLARGDRDRLAAFVAAHVT